MALSKKERARRAARAQQKVAGDGTIITRTSEENMPTKVVTAVEVANKEKEDSSDEDNEDGDNDNAVSKEEGIHNKSDESSVESKEVNAMSAKAKENARKKKKEATHKKTQKENITASSSSTTSKKRKAVNSKSDDNADVTSTKIVKKIKKTKA
eukprot:scaffold46469_cov50-Attheya_sp.AAC.1